MFKNIYGCLYMFIHIYTYSLYKKLFTCDGLNWIEKSSSILQLRNSQQDNINF